MAAAVPWLVPLLYGSEFAPSIVAIWVLLPGVVGLGVFKVVGSDLMGRGRPGLVGAYSCIALVTNVATNLLLIPRYGFVGAAISATVSYCLLACMTVIQFIREAGLAASEVLLPRPGDVRRALASLKGGGPRREDEAAL